MVKETVKWFWAPKRQAEEAKPTEHGERLRVFIFKVGLKRIKGEFCFK